MKFQISSSTWATKLNENPQNTAYHFDSRNRKKDIQVVPLSACSKDTCIENYLLSYSFTGPVNEVDLILCRAAILKIPANLESMTVCLCHVEAGDCMDKRSYKMQN